jgi:hypothetical protein
LNIIKGFGVRLENLISGVDKLSLVYAIKKEYQEKICKFFHSVAYRETGHSIYRYNFSISLYSIFPEFDNNEDFHIFLAPYNDNLNFLKIEYNPNKLKTSGVVKVLELMKVKTGCDVDFGKGIINRIDLNVDVYEEDMTVEFFYHFLKSNSRHNHVIIKNGHIETFYLGSPQSDSFIRVYDKYVESGNNPAYKNCVRIEKQINNLTVSLIDFITKFPEKFDFQLKFVEPVEKKCSLCEYFSFISTCLKYVVRNWNKKIEKIVIDRKSVLDKILYT